MTISPTALELELDGEGRLRFQGGMTAQYILTDRHMLTLVEDAYSPGREVRLQTGEVTLPAVLEERRENLYGEQTLPAEANLAADISFQADFPRQRRTEGTVEMEIPGTFQVLYYGEDGALRSGTARWEGSRNLPADTESRITAVPAPMEPQASLVGNQIQLQAEIPVDMTTTARQSLPMVTGLELGQPVRRDPGRPSLILRRAGKEGLWNLAKHSGSTPEAIRRANNLQTDPDPDQILLIPVG